MWGGGGLVSGVVSRRRDILTSVPINDVLSSKIEQSDQPLEVFWQQGRQGGPSKRLPYRGGRSERGLQSDHL